MSMGLATLRFPSYSSHQLWYNRRLDIGALHFEDKNQAKAAPQRVEESRLRILAAATTARLRAEAEMARLRDELYSGSQN